MNIVKGSKFTASLPIFTGSYPNSKYSHNVTVTAVVIHDSYGRQKGQHTFTFTVLESDDHCEFPPNADYQKKGRNLYPNISKLENPVDYAFQAHEKKKRAESQSFFAKRNNEFLEILHVDKTDIKYVYPKTGDLINHFNFGLGSVIGMDEKAIIVRFENSEIGEKRLYLEIPECKVQILNR